MDERLGAHLADRAVLQLHGPDTKDFLQGLISNDVSDLAPGRPLYAALLTPQGRYLFDFILHEEADGVLMESEAVRLEELRRRLLLYRLRSKVEIARRPDLVVVAVWGDTDGMEPVVSDPRLAALGRRSLLPADAVSTWMARHAVRDMGPDAYDRHRLALGVPDGSRDLIVQKALLLESNFEELHGVSFTKGCFVGQELTARTKHRGLVRKRLLPVRIDGMAPEPGTPLLQDGREAGEMRSARDGSGLALLRLEQLGKGPITADTATLVPTIPPWLDLG